MREMKKLLFGIMLVVLYSQALLAQAVDSDIEAKAWALEQTFRQERDSVILQALGKPYLPFAAISSEGNFFSEEQLVGKVTVVNFWFDCCTSCIQPLNYFNMLYAKYKENPKFQLVSFARDDISIAKEAVKKYQLPYAVFPINDNECYRLNYRSACPTCIIVDEKGNMVYHKVLIGDEDAITKDFQQVEELVTKLLL